MNLSDLSYTGMQKVTNECICGAIPKRVGIFIILIALLLSFKGVIMSFIESDLQKKYDSDTATDKLEFILFVYNMFIIIGLIMIGTVILLGSY